MSVKFPLTFMLLLLALIHNVEASDEFQQLYDSAKKHKSIPLAELSLKSAKSLENDELIARAYFLIAHYQKNQRMYYESLNNYFSALEYYGKAGNHKRYMDTLHGIGNLYAKGGFLKEAMDFYQEGIVLAKREKDIDRELSLRYQLAKTYRMNEEYDSATNMYQSLMPTLIKLKKEHLMSQCYLEMGYIVSIIGLGYDTANFFYTKAIEAYSTNSKDLSIAEIKKKYSLAYVNNKNGEYKNAKKLLLSALAQANESTYDPEMMIDIYSNLADAYEYLGVTDSAIMMYKQVLDYIDVEDFDFNYVWNAKLLYDYCKKFDLEESKACSKVIYDFTDEVVEFKDKLVEANIHYQVRAANYHRENELLYTQRQNNRELINLMIFLALGLVIFSGLVFYLYERKRRIEKWRKVLKELTIKPRFTKN